MRHSEVESWRPSQPVPSPCFRRPISPKSPPIGRYLATANGLRVTKFGIRSANSPKVSTDSLNYSRFLESPIGDYFDHRPSAQLAVLDASTCESREGPSEMGWLLTVIIFGRLSSCGGGCLLRAVKRTTCVAVRISTYYPNRTISRKDVGSPTHPSGMPALRMPSMMRSRWAR